MIAPGRSAWIQVARGSVLVNGTSLAAGDGSVISGEGVVVAVGGNSGAELLLFDLT